MKRFLLLTAVGALLILCQSGCAASKTGVSENAGNIENAGSKDSYASYGRDGETDVTGGESMNDTDSPYTDFQGTGASGIGAANGDNVKKVCIDPGHQRKGNDELEPVGPGAEEKKKKVSYGTKGVSTGIAEYRLNLEISLMLKEELIKRGYDVFMTRETDDVDISNMERAIMGNESRSDIAVRIHANGSGDPAVRGALTIYPSDKNPYVAHLSEDSKMLSERIIDNLCGRTGAKNRGALPRDTYTGSNWSLIPVTIVEMGYMSNPEEDALMATEEYRAGIVKGIADGIDGYFKEKA